MSAIGVTHAIESSPTRVAWLPALWTALVVSCFLLGRPYLGITHDAILYTGQALARGDPQVFHNDIYFQWGSQDQYTFFTPIFVYFTATLGLAGAHFSLVVASLALFLGTSFLLVRALLPAGLHGFAMLLIAASTGQYGPLRVFHMAEQYLSPRPFVEAATLGALLLLFSGRRMWALALLLVAGLLHPLMALAGLIFWWVYALLSGTNRPLLLGLLLAPVMAAIAGIEPFRQLFEVFDAEWFERIYDIHHLLFITHWNLADWSRVAFDLTVLFMAGRFCDERLGRMFRAAQITAIAVIAATFLGADVLHNVLITNLQPWRALWILHWLALAGLAIVLARTWNETGAGARLVVGLLLFGYVTRGTPSALFASILAMLLFAARGRVSVAPGVVTAVFMALGLGAFANWIVSDYRLLGAPFFMFDIADISPLRALGRTFPIMVGVGVILWLALRRSHVRTAAAAAIVALTVVVGTWDVRSEFIRYMESTAPGEHPFSRIVGPNEQVWWHGPSLAKESGGVLMAWVLMKRASYLSGTQHVGQHFNRDTTMELMRRDEIVRPFEFQDSICDLMALMNPAQARCQPDLEAAQDLCRDARQLDYLALESDYPGKWVATWSSPVPIGNRMPRFYLYACKTLVKR